MPGTLEVRAVLVDMDGTAVDSNAIVEQSWGQVAEEFGLDLPEVLAFSHGRPGVETFARFVPSLDSEEIRQRVAKMMDREQDLAHLVRPIPGSDVFLNRLVELGVPWALVTSAPRHLAAARFAHAGLPWPQVAVTVEDVSAGKPDPQGYQSAAELLGVPVEQCVVFEDAPAGIHSGLASGASVIVVNEGEPITPARLGPEADRFVNIVAQVPDLRGFTAEPTADTNVFRLSWA